MVLVALIVVTTTTSAHAVLDLTGVEMQGELFINTTVPPPSGTPNYFDPGTGKVPAGFGNSPSPGGTGEASAFVSDTIVEFGYQGTNANPATDTTTNFQVNFHNNGVVQVTANTNPFTTVNMNFNSPAFQNPNQTITFTAISPSPAITTATFTNSTLTFGFAMTTGAFSGTYLLNVAGTPPPQIPEPASLTLLSLGLLGIIARFRKRA